MKQVEDLCTAVTIEETRQHIKRAKQTGPIVGFVPTMGALHAGHRKLMETARRECGFVIVSIFVNPLQFDQPNDLAQYPRTFEADQLLCAKAGVDLVFAPTVRELYPGVQRTFVEVPDLTRTLCGEFRPGHFRGVATVVLKLFGIVQPDRAYFGQKDAQQLAVIQAMVRDLNVPVQIISVPTVREPDGLALSSRNQRLTSAERQIAPALYRALCFASKQAQSGVRSAALIRESAIKLVQCHPELKVEYLELVDASTLEPVEQVSGSVLIAAAVWLGATRLIDNILLQDMPSKV